MAARFWVGGTGNWDAADTTHWAATSGGAGGQSVPGSGDTVTLDGSSGGGTVTMTAAVDVTSITMGAFTGTLDTNDQTVTVQTFSNSGTATRTLDLGASTITVTGTGNAWVASTGTNLTLTPGTSEIILSGSSAAFLNGNSAAPKTYYNVSFTGSGTAELNALSSHSYNNLTRTGTSAKTDGIQFSGVGPTVTGTLTINGNSSVNRVLVRSNTLGTARTITAANVSISNADFRDITGAGAASWDLSAITGLSGDCGGNSGITFTTGTTTTATGSSSNWSTATWDVRVPLPQDTVVLSLTAGQTLTNDMPRMGKDISVTTAMNLATNTSGQTVYGSLNITNISSFTGSSSMTFEGRGTHTLTSGGKTFPQGIVIQMVGGTLTLNDALTTTTTVGHTNGTFNTGNFNVMSTTYTHSAQTSTRATTLGTSVWTLTGTGTVWNISTTGWTLSAASSSIYITDVSASSKTFVGGTSQIYGDIRISGGGAGAVIFQSATIYNRIYTDGGGTKTLTFPAGATTTLSYTGTDNFGNGNHLLTIASSSGGSAFTISKPVGRFEGDYLNLTDSTATGTFYAGEHSVNVSGNSGWIFSAFSPNQSGGLTMWLDALDGGDGTFTDRLNKTAYTATSVTRGANVNDGTEMIFNGTSSKIECGNIGEIYSVTFWVKPGTNACSLIDFNGTEYISTVSGTVTATSWTSPTIYVNGVVSSVLPTGVWSHVAVTSSTSVTASTVILGLVGSTYGDCSLTNIKMYDRVLSATDIGRQVPSFPSANRALLQDLVDYTGLTFYKNYGLPNINSVNADYASGSATGTWTVTRGTTTPATYCDADGTIQLVTGTNPRFTQGFYDSTGFVSRPGLIVEGASTNYLTYSNGVASSGGLWTGFSEANDTGTSATLTQVDASSLTGISGSYAQRMQLSGQTSTSKTCRLAATVTAAGTFAQNDVVTGSVWIRSQSGTPSGYQVKIAIHARDAASTALTEFVGSDISTSITSSWKRFTYTTTLTDAGTSRAIMRFGSSNTVDTGDVVDLEFWGPQLEKLPFASTFIPTSNNASGLTRNAETLTYPISGNRTAATESLFVKFTPFWSGSDLSLGHIILDTDGSRRVIYADNGTDSIIFIPNLTDTPTATTTTTTDPSKGTSYVISAVAVSPTDATNQNLYVDGSLQSTSLDNYTSPTYGTNFYVGVRFSSTQQSFAIIQSLAIFSDAKNATAVAGITDLIEAL